MSAARARVLGAALVLGALSLMATSRASVPRLVWNDELVFAAAGRHVADGDGPVSSFYHPDAIAARGMPLHDVHMPGQAFVLGTAFALLGPSDWAAVLTSRLAFLAALLLLAGAVEAAWGARAALAAAVLFVLFPPNVAFAHTAMSESVFTALVAGFLALWTSARRRPSLGTAAGMAAVLGLGAIHHETIVVFVPAALWAAARWPDPLRRRGLAVIVAVLAACLVAAAPWSLARAPYPHALTEIVVASGTPAQRVGRLLGNLLANVRGVPLTPSTAWEWNHALQWVTVLAAAVLGIRAGGARREMAGLALLGFAGTWAALAPFYPIGDWRAVRVFMHTMVPALAVVGDALAARAGGWTWPRTAGRAAALAAVTAVGAASLVSISRDRGRSERFGRAYSEFLRSGLAGRDVRILVAPKAYRYGWDAYPVAVVVWQATDLKRVRDVEQRVPVDAIVVRPAERRRFQNGVRNGSYRRSFHPLEAAPFQGLYELFVADGPRPPG